MENQLLIIIVIIVALFVIHNMSNQGPLIKESYVSYDVHPVTIFKMIFEKYKRDKNINYNDANPLDRFTFLKNKFEKRVLNKPCTKDKKKKIRKILDDINKYKNSDEYNKIYNNVINDIQSYRKLFLTAHGM